MENSAGIRECGTKLAIYHFRWLVLVSVGLSTHTGSKGGTNVGTGIPSGTRVWVSGATRVISRGVQRVVR